MKLEHEAAILALVQPDGIDGGVVYEDQHVRLSEVLTVIDSWGSTHIPEYELAGDDVWNVVRDAVAEYIERHWPVDEGQLTRMARAESLVNRIRQILEPEEPRSE